MINQWQRFLAPKYWPTWIGIGFLRLIAWLPLGWQRFIGRRLGRLALLLLNSRRRVAEINLRLSFPEDSEAQTQAKLHAHFEHLGMMVIETGLTWFGSNKRLRKHTIYHGLDHLQRARNSDQGVMCLTAHMGPIDLGGRMLAQVIPEACASYRPDRKQPLLTAWMHHARSNYGGQEAIARDDLKAMLRQLRRGDGLWYGPDQNMSVNTLHAPFFGQLASTTNAISKLAAKTNALVVPYHAVRTERGFELFFEPAWDDLRSASEQEIAERYNATIERWVRANPSQYYWVHKRFKNRSNNATDPYTKLIGQSDRSE